MRSFPTHGSSISGSTYQGPPTTPRYNVFWNGPNGIAVPATVYEASGHFTRKGKRGEGKFSASATVHREWDCNTGQARWRTRGT